MNKNSVSFVCELLNDQGYSLYDSWTEHDPLLRHLPMIGTVQPTLHCMVIGSKHIRITVDSMLCERFKLLHDCRRGLQVHIGCRDVQAHQAYQRPLGILNEIC